MKKSLNEIYKEIIDNGNIDKESIDAFIEIDGMCSSTTMAWMIDLLKRAYTSCKSNKLSYEGKLLNDELFKKLLEDNLSDYVIKNVFN